MSAYYGKLKFCCALQCVVIWLLGSFILYVCIDSGGREFERGTTDVGCRNELEALRKQNARLTSLLKKVSATDSSLSKMAFYPIIYIVTPTYKRLSQKADLVRLSQTLMHVPNIHWLVVEDAEEKSDVVSRLLTRSGIPHTYLNVQTPLQYKLQQKDPSWLKPRGVHQRNLALSWLRQAHKNRQGVVYFADDDNTYDLALFEEIRTTKYVSVWPVGLVGGLLWEGPKVENGKVVEWITAWKPDRPFPIDMAGFAISLHAILDNPSAEFGANRPRGYVESSFLEIITSPFQMEPKAANCTKVLVWHTQTVKYKTYSKEKLKSLHLESLLFTDVEV